MHPPSEMEQKENKLNRDIIKKVICRTIAVKIVADISDREGLGDEWDGCDDGVKKEILDTWSEIIEEELDKGAKYEVTFRSA